jgi:hypothetical protein
MTGSVREVGLEACPVQGVGAAVGAADQAVFLQHLQIPANRFGGDIESLGQLGHLDVPGAAGMIQDQPPAFVACPGLHSTVSLPTLAR